MIPFQLPTEHGGWLALACLLVLASLLACPDLSAAAAPRVRPQSGKSHGVRKASPHPWTPRDGKSPRRKRAAATDPRLRAILWAPRPAPESMLPPTASDRERLVDSLQDEIAPPDTSPQLSDGTLPTLVWPVAGTINSPFGPRHRRFHAGLDIGAPKGQPVLAAADGVILYAGPSRGPMGIAIVLQHADGLQTIYAHLGQHRVREGALVSQGDPIGTVGNTGRSTGPHLHFGVRVDGTTVNPQAYLPPLSDSPDLPLTAQATAQ